MRIFSGQAFCWWTRWPWQLCARAVCFAAAGSVILRSCDTANARSDAIVIALTPFAFGTRAFKGHRHSISCPRRSESNLDGARGRPHRRAQARDARPRPPIALGVRIALGPRRYAVLPRTGEVRFACLDDDIHLERRPRHQMLDANASLRRR